MKTTFELIEQYFNSTQDNCEKKVMLGYTLNGTIIKIQYMDGTFKTIKNADDLEISNELYDYMFNFEKEDV